MYKRKDTVIHASLCLSSEQQFTSLQLGEIAKELVHISDVGSVKDAYHLLQSMAALTGSGKLARPVRLQLTSAAVSIREVRFLST